MAEWAIAIGAIGTFITMIIAITNFLIPIKTDVAGIKKDNVSLVERLDRHSDNAQRMKEKQKKLESDSSQAVFVLKQMVDQVKDHETRLDQLRHEHDLRTGPGGCSQEGK